MNPNNPSQEEAALLLAMTEWKAMEERTKDRISKAGMRLTEQRRLMLRILARSKDPLTADELQERIEKGSAGSEVESIDVTTLYRALVALESVQLIRRLDFGDGLNRYEYDNGNLHHHFVVCRKCGKRERMEISPMAVLHQMAKLMGYANISHVATVFGDCAECQAKG